MPKITIPDVIKKHLTIIAYLLISGVLGYALAEYANNPQFAVLLAPAINYILYAIKKELDSQGFVQAVRNETEQ